MVPRHHHDHRQRHSHSCKARNENISAPSSKNCIGNNRLIQQTNHCRDIDYVSSACSRTRTSFQSTDLQQPTFLASPLQFNECKMSIGGGSAGTAPLGTSSETIRSTAAHTLRRLAIAAFVLLLLLLLKIVFILFSVVVVISVTLAAVVVDPTTTTTITTMKAAAVFGSGTSYAYDDDHHQHNDGGGPSSSSFTSSPPPPIPTPSHYRDKNALFFSFITFAAATTSTTTTATLEGSIVSCASVVHLPPNNISSIIHIPMTAPWILQERTMSSGGGGDFARVDMQPGCVLAPDPALLVMPPTPAYQRFATIQFDVAVPVGEVVTTTAGSNNNNNDNSVVSENTTIAIRIRGATLRNTRLVFNASSALLGTTTAMGAMKRYRNFTTATSSAEMPSSSSPLSASSSSPPSSSITSAMPQPLVSFYPVTIRIDQTTFVTDQTIASNPHLQPPAVVPQEFSLVIIGVLPPGSAIIISNCTQQVTIRGMPVTPQNFKDDNDAVFRFTFLRLSNITVAPGVSILVDRVALRGSYEDGLDTDADYSSLALVEFSETVANDTTMAPANLFAVVMNVQKEAMTGSEEHMDEYRRDFDSVLCDGSSLIIHEPHVEADVLGADAYRHVTLVLLLQQRVAIGGWGVIDTAVSNVSHNATRTLPLYLATQCSPSSSSSSSYSTEIPTDTDGGVLSMRTVLLVVNASMRLTASRPGNTRRVLGTIALLMQQVVMLESSLLAITGPRTTVIMTNHSENALLVTYGRVLIEGGSVIAVAPNHKGSIPSSSSTWSSSMTARRGGSLVDHGDVERYLRANPALDTLLGEYTASTLTTALALAMPALFSTSSSSIAPSWYLFTGISPGFEGVFQLDTITPIFELRAAIAIASSTFFVVSGQSHWITSGVVMTTRYSVAMVEGSYFAYLFAVAYNTQFIVAGHGSTFRLCDCNFSFAPASALIIIDKALYFVSLSIPFGAHIALRDGSAGVLAGTSTALTAQARLLSMVNLVGLQNSTSLALDGGSSFEITQNQMTGRLSSVLVVTNIIGSLFSTLRVSNASAIAITDNSFLWTSSGVKTVVQMIFTTERACAHLSAILLFNASSVMTVDGGSVVRVARNNISATSLCIFITFSLLDQNNSHVSILQPSLLIATPSSSFTTRKSAATSAIRNAAAADVAAASSSAGRRYHGTPMSLSVDHITRLVVVDNSIAASIQPAIVPASLLGWLLPKGTPTPPPTAVGLISINTFDLGTATTTVTQRGSSSSSSSISGFADLSLLRNVIVISPNAATDPLDTMITTLRGEFALPSAYVVWVAGSWQIGAPATAALTIAENSLRITNGAKTLAVDLVAIAQETYSEGGGGLLGIRLLHPAAYRSSESSIRIFYNSFTYTTTPATAATVPAPPVRSILKTPILLLGGGNSTSSTSSSNNYNIPQAILLCGNDFPRDLRLVYGGQGFAVDALAAAGVIVPASAAAASSLTQPPSCALSLSVSFSHPSPSQTRPTPSLSKPSHTRPSASPPTTTASATPSQQTPSSTASRPFGCPTSCRNISVSGTHKYSKDKKKESGPTPANSEDDDDSTAMVVCDPITLQFEHWIAATTTSTTATTTTTSDTTAPSTTIPTSSGSSINTSTTNNNNAANILSSAAPSSSLAAEKTTTVATTSVTFTSTATTINQYNNNNTDPSPSTPSTAVVSTPLLRHGALLLAWPEATKLTRAVLAAVTTSTSSAALSSSSSSSGSGGGNARVAVAVTLQDPTSIPNSLSDEDIPFGLSTSVVLPLDVRFDDQISAATTDVRVEIALYFWCNDSRPLTFSAVLSAPPPPLPVLLKPLEDTLAATGAAYSIFAGAAAMDLQTLALLGIVSCSTGVARQGSASIRTLAPTALDHTCPGAILGNWVLVAGVAVLQLAAVGVLYLKKERQAQQQQAGCQQKEPQTTSPLPIHGDSAFTSTSTRNAAAEVGGWNRSDPTRRDGGTNKNNEYDDNASNSSSSGKASRVPSTASARVRAFFPAVSSLYVALIPSMETVQFPSVALLLAATTANGMLACGADVLKTSTKSAEATTGTESGTLLGGASDGALTILGAAALLWVLFVVTAFALITRLFFSRAFGQVYYNWRGPLLASAARILMPRGKLDPEVPGTKMFQAVCGAIRHPGRWWFLVRFIPLVAVAPVAAGTGDACFPLYLLAACLHVLCACFIAVSRPYAIFITNAFVSTALATNGVVIVLYALLLRDPLAAPAGLSAALNALVAAQLVLSTLRVIHRAGVIIVTALTVSGVIEKPLFLSSDWEIACWPHPARGSSVVFYKAFAAAKPSSFSSFASFLKAGGGGGGGSSIGGANKAGRATTKTKTSNDQDKAGDRGLDQLLLDDDEDGDDDAVTIEAVQFCYGGDNNTGNNNIHQEEMEEIKIDASSAFTTTGGAARGGSGGQNNSSNNNNNSSFISHRSSATATSTAAAPTTVYLFNRHSHHHSHQNQPQNNNSSSCSIHEHEHQRHPLIPAMVDTRQHPTGTAQRSKQNGGGGHSLNHNNNNNNNNVDLLEWVRRQQQQQQPQEVSSVGGGGGGEVGPAAAKPAALSSLSGVDVADI